MVREPTLLVDDVPPLSTIYFYITNSCNLSCAHCWLSMQHQADRRNELSTGEIRSILEQALPLGLQSVKITGGEPFIRDDIAEIVDHAGVLGLSTTIETNATLLDEDTASALGQCAGLDHVAVSLDGATPDSHARLRGSVATFETATRGIDRLVRNGVQVQIITVLHRGNVHEIDALTGLAAGLGAASLKLNPITRMGRGQEMADRGELLSLREVLDVNQHLEDGSGDPQDMPVYMSLPVAFLSLDAIRRQGFGSCGVMNLLAVLATGELSVCGIGQGQPDLVFGHMRDTPIRKVWEESPGLAHIRQEISRWPTGICERCMVRAYCTWGYCRAEAHVLSGSIAAPAPFCQASFEAGLFPSGRLLP